MKTPTKKIQIGAVFCSQIALDAVVFVIAVRKTTLIAAKINVAGTSLPVQRGRLTSGNRIRLAKLVRQNANRGPRTGQPSISVGQLSNKGALAKKPLVLHSTAAAKIINRAFSLLGRLSSVSVSERSGTFIVLVGGTLVATVRYYENAGGSTTIATVLAASREGRLIISMEARIDGKN